MHYGIAFNVHFNKLKNITLNQNLKKKLFRLFTSGLLHMVNVDQFSKLFISVSESMAQRAIPVFSYILFN